MRILSRVEMNCFQAIFMTTKDYWNVEPVSETRFVVNPASRSSFSMGEIRHQETSSPNCGNDGVVNLVELLLLIDT